MFKHIRHLHTHRASVLLVIALCFLAINVAAAELPVLHLRKSAAPPPIVAKLQDPATASAWYPASPTWFGLGGQTGDRNHTEVLATYDSSALRFRTLANWKWIRQIATGLTAGKTYTFSGWYKGSASGIKSDVRLQFQAANGAYVRVTGVSSIEKSGGVHIRVLRTRSSSDVQVVATQ